MYSFGIGLAFTSKIIYSLRKIILFNEGFVRK